VVFVAPLDVVFSPHDVVEPDVLFFTPSGFKQDIGERNAEGPPDLAIEVLSPSTRRRGETLKRRLYGRRGVGEYWIVDPKARTVRVFRLHGGKRQPTELTLTDTGVLETPLFPDLQLPLASVFEMP